MTNTKTPFEKSLVSIRKAVAAVADGSVKELDALIRATDKAYRSWADAGLPVCSACGACLEPDEVVRVQWVPGEYSPADLCAECHDAPDLSGDYRWPPITRRC